MTEDELKDLIYKRLTEIVGRRWTTFADITDVQVDDISALNKYSPKERNEIISRGLEWYQNSGKGRSVEDTTLFLQTMAELDVCTKLIMGYDFMPFPYDLIAHIIIKYRDGLKNDDEE
jgi:hypothetical protein